MARVAMVMSGGGARGAFEVGAADYLIREHGVDPQALVGVSTGNLNAAMLAQGKGRDGLIENLDLLRGLWFGLNKNSDIYKRRLLGVVGLAVKADSVYSNKPLWELIQTFIRPEKLSTSGRLLRVGVVGLKSGEYRVIDGRNARIREMILASTSIPVYFKPVDADGERFVDGGVRNVTPLNTAFDALAELEAAQPGGDDPDTIYVILASPLAVSQVDSDKELNGGIGIGKRSLELLVNEVYANDLQLALTVNEAVRYYDRLKTDGVTLPEGFPFEGCRYVNLVVVQPERLYLDGLEFNHDKIVTAYEAGRAAARSAVDVAAQFGGSNVTRRMFTN